jgi:hypothetical protein
MPAPTFSGIEVTADGARGELHLNFPEKLNPLSVETLSELAEAARWFDRHPDLKVVVVAERPPPTQWPCNLAIVTAAIRSIASAISRPASAASRGLGEPSDAPANAKTSAPAENARPRSARRGLRSADRRRRHALCDS